MTAIESAGVTVADVLGEIRATLDNCALGLKRIDRLDIRQYSDAHLDRGYVVRAPRSANSGQYRDNHLARVVDTIQIDTAHRIRPAAQVQSHDDATVLAEQIRALVTSRLTAWGDHIVYVSDDRAITGEDGAWLIITQTYTTRRDAAMGG